ncbi:VanZ family protein [Geobacter sp.]|uniref:VanZ family protein n=1 Tax=Geobacter sp. TaxID=46610 RepID=UPI0026142353|nr:VanZ family protein [Geobacter sp.]
MRRFQSLLSRSLPLLFWAALVAWLSLIPAPPKIPSGLFGWDKFQHGVAYALLCLLAGWCFRSVSRWQATRWRRAFFVSVVFGALMEVAQGTLTTNRSPEWGDLAADAVGAGVVAAGFWCYGRLRRRI